jgi:probable HAF family extracellular repeat protein
MWQRGTMTDLGSLQGEESIAVAINGRGQVIGNSGDLAFVWQHGKMTALATLAGTDVSGVDAINSSGQIIGTATTSGGAPGEGGGCVPSWSGPMRAVLWKEGKPRDLGTLGCEWSTPGAINEHAQIVGSSATKSGELHAFLWEDGKMIDLSTLPGGKSSGALALNNHNQIVGWSDTKKHEPHAVLWTLKQD